LKKAEEQALVKPDSIVEKFYKRLEELSKEAEYPLNTEEMQVVYWLSSEVIGPSVPLAELVFHMLRKSKYDGTFDKILDLFCGSGAISIAAVMAKIVKSAYRAERNYAFTTVGVDQDITIAAQMRSFRHLNALVAANFEDLDHRFYMQSFDFIAADPPHIIILDFLEDIQRKLSYLKKPEVAGPEFLPKIFLVHYGRDFQPSWNKYILNLLKNSELWDNVFDIKVGKAKLALCTTRFEVKPRRVNAGTRALTNEDSREFTESDFEELYNEFAKSMVEYYNYAPGMIGKEKA
jgi:hypothetical protein